MALARQLARDLIGELPLSSISFAFAYGSGVIPQEGEDPTQKMVDIVLCTRNAATFHKENVERNPGHYSCVRKFGPRAMCRLQNSAAAVYYNTHVRTPTGRLIKYGVIEQEALKADLLDWRWLYIAGRLHKPVVDILPCSPEVEECIKVNRLAAVQAALLLLPDTFTNDEFFQKIVSLSYNGDFRMLIGEDRGKIAKIASGNAAELEEIYMPLLQEDSRVAVQPGNVIQDASTTAVYHRLNMLPSEVLQRLVKHWNKTENHMSDAEEMLYSLAHRHDVAMILEQTMASIVRSSSIRQSAKNAMTAGLTRSIVYSAAKLTKWGKSVKKEIEDEKKKRIEPEKKKDDANQ